MNAQAPAPETPLPFIYAGPCTAADHLSLTYAAAPAHLSTHPSEGNWAETLLSRDMLLTKPGLVAG